MSGGLEGTAGSGGLPLELSDNALVEPATLIAARLLLSL